jgi:23S rRNA (adenine2503-C2)-methyltransferase
MKSTQSDLEVVTTLRSVADDLVKYLFRMPSGIDVEAVDYTPSNRAIRWDVCISTQSGCAVGCSFCGTGSRFLSNLESSHILAQLNAIVACRPEVDPREVHQFRILFMSMGEPALNAASVINAILTISELYPRAEQIVSTVGIGNSFLEQFLKLTRTIPHLGLQFSIHSPLTAERKNLIPYPNLLSLSEIAAWARRFREASGRRARANFIVFADWADSTLREQRLTALTSFFPNDDFHINLSPLYDTGKAGPLASQALMDIITDDLSSLGYTVSRSLAAGLDVGGSCGQLWHVQPLLRNRGKFVIWQPSKLAELR